MEYVYRKVKRLKAQTTRNQLHYVTWPEPTRMRTTGFTRVTTM